MKRKLAVAIAIIFGMGVMVPAFASTYYNTPIGRPTPVDMDKVYATSTSTKHYVASVFALKKLSSSSYKKGQLIIKVKDKKDLNAKFELKWKVNIEKKLMDDMVLVSFDDTKTTIEKMMRNLNLSEAIYFTEPNYIRTTSSFKQKLEPSPTQQQEPSPTLPPSQWALTNTLTQSAWSITKGSPDLIVGVIDTGIDYTNPDLINSIYKNPNELPGDNIDNDLNGYIDDTSGYDFANNDSDTMDADFEGHGTHVSGIIAASNNDFGVTGVAPEVKILPLKVANDEDGNILTSSVAEALNYGKEMGIEIFNCSYGGGDSDPAEYAVLKNYPEALFICAAGNGDTETGLPNDTDITSYYPADYDLDNIISVASISETNELSSFSNYGKITVDLAAPGEDIYSTVKDAYGYLDGTSMAAPFVTGAVSLMKSINPNMTVLKVKEKLLASVTPLDTLTDKMATGGKLNVSEAVSSARTDIQPTTGVKISLDTLDLLTGTKIKLDAALLPNNAYTKYMTWTSSNKLVATVDGKGNVKAISKGTANITATDTQTNYAANCQITVTNFKPPVFRPGSTIMMTFNTPEFIYGKANIWLIRPDGTEEAFALQSNYTDENYTLTIKVDKDGLISGNRLDPFKYNGTWEVEFLQITEDDNTANIFYNEKFFDSADENSTPMSLERKKFLISDNLHPEIDTSLNNFNNSMDKSLGKPIVYTGSSINTKDFYQGNKLSLKVLAKARAGIYMAYITFVKPDGTELEPQNMGINPRGGYFYYNMTVSDIGKWRVKELQLIDSSYNKIYVKDIRYAEGSDMKDLSNLDFTVHNKFIKATKIIFEKKELILKKGKIIKPLVAFSPKTVSSNILSYSSSNPSVASVNKFGIITAKKIGKTTIKAVTKDGSKLTTTIKIIVK